MYQFKKMDKKKIAKKAAKIAITALLAAMPILQSISGVIAFEASIPVVGKSLKNALSPMIADAATGASTGSSPIISQFAGAGSGTTADGNSAISQAGTVTPQAVTDALNPDQINDGFPSVATAVGAGANNANLSAPFNGASQAVTYNGVSGYINPSPTSGTNVSGANKITLNSVSVLVVGSDKKPYIVYDNNSYTAHGLFSSGPYSVNANGVQAAIQYIQSRNSPTTNYVICINSNWEPGGETGGPQVRQGIVQHLRH